MNLTVIEAAERKVCRHCGLPINQLPQGAYWRDDDCYVQLPPPIKTCNGQDYSHSACAEFFGQKEEYNGACV